MIKGIEKGLEAVESARSHSTRRGVFPPNIDTGSDKMTFRILSDAGQIGVHSLFAPELKKHEDTKALQFIADSGRYWDFCIRDNDTECPHCIDSLNSSDDKSKRYKKFQTKFVFPVLVRPYHICIPAKAGREASEKDLPLSVGYLMVNTTVATNIKHKMEEAREIVGDEPNAYLTYCDLKIYKTREGSKNGFPMTVVDRPMKLNAEPLSEDEKATVCEFFNIEEYSAENVENAMLKEWEEMEKEAINRLSKVEPVQIHEDNGDVPDQFKEDVKL